jgi:hypothetical protein
MMTLDEIQASQREVMADDRRVREQVARYETRHAEFNMRLEHAMLQYAYAMGSLWAMALRPGPLNGPEHG